MTFAFLHSSDWHIGKPFGRFHAEQGSVLRRARLMAIDRLATAARGGGALHVLVAGDVYDRPTIADRDLHAPLQQLRAHADLTWHIIPGNHDPAVTGGAWERVMRAGLPGNVRLYLDASPVEIAAGCWLLPAPLSAKAMTRDPTEWMDTAPTPPGCLRIGLAHGSIQGFGGERAASIEIAPDRARRAGLSYLALGDWHGFLQVGPATVYSGTPEPDGFLDTASGNGTSGNAVLVKLEGASASPVLSRRETGQHRWVQRRIEAARSTDLAALEGEVEGWGAAARDALLSVEATGRATILEDQDLRRRLERLETRIFHLDRRLEKLTIRAGDEDLARLGEGALRDVGLALSGMAADPAGEDAAVAARALRYLFEFADREPSTGGQSPVGPGSAGGSLA